MAWGRPGSQRDTGKSLSHRMSLKKNFDLGETLGSHQVPLEPEITFNHLETLGKILESSRCYSSGKAQVRY